MYRRRRSTYCKFCYEHGHTYVTCGKLKEHIKSNPNSYWNARLAQRAESAKHRKCSYCGEEKHNKKTCKYLEEDKLVIGIANIEYRKKFLENIIVGAGIGPGALIKIKNSSGYINKKYEYNLADRVAMVTDVISEDVYNVGMDHRCEAVRVQWLDVFDYYGSQMNGVVGLPNWYIFDPTKDDPHNEVNFEVIGRSYYNIDEPDTWVKDPKVIKTACDKFTVHYSVTNTQFLPNKD